MIAHVSIGVRDIHRSKRFYDAALEPLGVQVPEARENAAGLRVWSRQHRTLGCPGRAPGSSRRKVGSALLLHSGECRRRRCVSRSRAALWRA
jgi:catechol 2,3-dioxygenase-like lactoylglutathione lyase family enzyme